MTSDADLGRLYRVHLTDQHAAAVADRTSARWRVMELSRVRRWAAGHGWDVSELTRQLEEARERLDEFDALVNSYLARLAAVKGM